ncbi:hypothetical protein F5146DRAFT_1002655 [Armillaria mellea]|nr:hypothetical protein F5146DRAFT_1002655 [Armillaria mellea]
MYRFAIPWVDLVRLQEKPEIGRSVTKTQNADRCFRTCRWVAAARTWEVTHGWLQLELEKFRLSASDCCWPATVIDLNIISSLGVGQNHLLEEEGDLMAAESDAVIEWGVKLVNIDILATQFGHFHTPA